MWNSIWHANDNGKSFTFHYHLLQSNLDSVHIQVDMGLINNISNKTTILWQTITKASTSIISDINVEVEENVAGTDNSIYLRFPQVGAEFLPILFDDIQPFVGSQ